MDVATLIIHVFTKTCLECGSLKVKTEYWRCRKSADGFYNICKICDKHLRADHPSRKSDYRRARLESWRNRNRLRVRELCREYADRNPGYVALKSARKKAAKANRSMPLSDHDKQWMRKIYDDALKQSQVTGRPHDVDHVIPLRGDLVSGLHVPWNLQIMSASKNRAKRNIVDEDSLTIVFPQGRSF
jgi:hypothetical protein